MLKKLRSNKLYAKVETENNQGAKVVPWIGELLSQVRVGLLQNRQAIIGPLEEIGVGNLG